MLIDTHCHLDLPEFDADRESVLNRARSAGVERFIVVGFEPERWASTLRLADTEPGVFAAIGLHPTEADRWGTETEDGVRTQLHHDRVRAVGEIGLDYHWDRARPEAQKDAFADQIGLARDAGLPFIVHQRDAEADALDLLRSFQPPLRGVMHCFTGDASFAHACLDLGLFLGVGGAITHKRMNPLREAMTIVPLERILLETDAPYMSPEPHRSRRNEPSTVSVVAERLAELRKISPDEVEAVTSRSASQLFRLEAPAISSGCADE